MIEKRKCSECNSQIKGRADKKFCDDNCRNNYNNRLNSDATNFARNINNILRKNRRILHNLKKKPNSKVRKISLLDKGFRFDYHTNIYNTKSGKEYVFCYDLGYLYLDNDWYMIVEKKEYVD